MSICAAIGYRWDGKRTKLFFQTRDGSYKAYAEVSEFLEHGLLNILKSRSL